MKDDRLKKLNELSKLLQQKINDIDRENEKDEQEKTPNEKETKTKKKISENTTSQIQITTKDNENNKVMFQFLPQEKQYKKKFGIWKKEIKPDSESIKAYLLYMDGSNNTKILPINKYEVQYSIENKEKHYYFLDKAILTHKGKPMFWIYKDIIVTVDNIKTENERFVTVFSPKNWFNIIENVVTNKLTMGESGGITGFIGKHWKIILVVVITVGGYLVSTGKITTP